MTLETTTLYRPVGPKELADLGKGALLLQFQRDCVLQRRVARNELPRVGRPVNSNPNGVASGFRRAATPLGLSAFCHISQGSSLLATLGFVPESLWDSSQELKGEDALVAQTKKHPR
jgi:hypothetical protein